MDITIIIVDHTLDIMATMVTMDIIMVTMGTIVAITDTMVATMDIVVIIGTLDIVHIQEVVMMYFEDKTRPNFNTKLYIIALIVFIHFNNNFKHYN